jgi:hypothetical protein
MSSRTWCVKTAKLRADEKAASVVVRLMMALNDIAMANEGLGEWTVTRERRKLARQNGGRLYYGRMLMAHVYEALSIIEDIQNSPELKALVQACDPATRSSFDAVAAFLKTADFEMLCRIRNNASFHYDGKLAVRALEQIDKKFPGHAFTYSLGHEPLDWYFELGDLMLDRIVVRDIFKAAESIDVRAAIDPILMRMHMMASAFSDFGGDFIRNQLKRY